MIHFIPEVKTLRFMDGFLKHRAIHYNDANYDERVLKALKKLPYDLGGADLEITVYENNSEGYELYVREESISIYADSPAGAFYAIQTLRQIFICKEIPCLYIKDRPDFSYRGFYHDITRGKVPTLDTLKTLVDQMAYLKLNSLQLYVEHTFAFAEYADSIGRTGYLTAEEIKELDDYCHENFIELIPSLSCFGHLYELLQKPQFAHLQAIENYEQDQVFWIDRMLHHTIDPLNEESIQLICGMIDQYIPMFRSDKFNICCDETFDLKGGKYKDLDTGELYVGFVTKLIQHLYNRGKQTMMWGDVLHWHPERISDIPDDVILLNWDYGTDAQWTDTIVKRFANEGKLQIVCPAVWAWNNLSEKLSISIPNITNTARLARQYGAFGMLNTNWGDWGTPCSLELSQFGLAYGAQKSWNVETSLEQFVQAAEVLIYSKQDMFTVLDCLNRIEDTVKWSDFVQCYSNLLFGKTIDEISLPEKNALLAACEACEKLRSELATQVWQKDNYRQEVLLAAEGLEVIAELLYQIKNGQLIRHTDTEAWLTKYKEAWLSKNKPSELNEIEKLFQYMQAYISA